MVRGSPTFDFGQIDALWEVPQVGMLVALASRASTRGSTSFWVSGSFGTTFVCPTGTFAGGIDLDRAGKGLTVFFDFGVISYDVHFAKPGEMLLERLSEGFGMFPRSNFVWAGSPHAGGIWPVRG